MSTDAVVVPAYQRAAPALKPVLLLVGIAAAVAAGVSVVLWSQGPTYSLLYGNLGAEDSVQIAQALEQAGIPYRLESGSQAISVPADRVSDARLKLAAQGLPEGGGGLALLSKESGFGVSQFMEGARYQHALELELARTIASLRPVEAARVHLAVPRQSAFIRDRRPPSASVFVQLKPGRRLEPQQVQAVVNLVASSIPELEAGQVTVVDQHGRLLSSPTGRDEFTLREQQLELVHRLESEYATRIEALLTPLVGQGRVRAQVVAQVDMAVTEEAREQYRPDSQIVRSEQLAEQTSREGAGPQGVPGALTNQPPVAGAALPPGGAAAAPGAAAAAGTAAAASAAPESLSRQSTRNYEIDRTLAYTRQPAGRLKRLTVAVLLDNVRTVSQDGAVQETPLSAEQLAHVTRLVKDAVGFDESRGDSVNVVNAPFQGEAAPPPGEPAAIPLWEQPIVRELAKLLVGAVILLALLLAIVRPLVRSLMASLRPVAAPALASGPAGEALPAPGAGARTEAMPAGAPALQSPPLAYEQQLAQARSLVTQDPKRVAQVVRTWVSEDE